MVDILSNWYKLLINSVGVGPLLEFNVCAHVYGCETYCLLVVFWVSYPFVVVCALI